MGAQRPALCIPPHAAAQLRRHGCRGRCACGAPPCSRAGAPATPAWEQPRLLARRLGTPAARPRAVGSERRRRAPRRPGTPAWPSAGPCRVSAGGPGRAAWRPLGAASANDVAAAASTRARSPHSAAWRAAWAPAARVSPARRCVGPPAAACGSAADPCGVATAGRRAPWKLAGRWPRWSRRRRRRRARGARRARRAQWEARRRQVRRPSHGRPLKCVICREIQPACGRPWGWAWWSLTRQAP